MLPGLLILSVAACDDWPGVGDGDGGVTGGAARAEDTSGLLGSSCNATTLCRGTLSCVAQAPGGLCTKACSTDDDCDQVGSCQYVPDWGGTICLKLCTSDEVCRPQYSCQFTGAANVCFEAPSTADGG